MPSIRAPRRILLLAVIALAALAGASLLRDAGVGPARAAPFYDNFDGRDYWYADVQDVFPLDRTYTTAGATLEPGESAPCASIGATVWAQYTADRSGTLEISARGDAFRAIVAIYEMDWSGDFLPSPPGGHLIAADCGIADGGAPAVASVSLIRDRTYMVQIGGWDGAAGSVAVHASCACAPANDDFERPFDVYVDAYNQEFRVERATAFATVQAGEPLPCGDIGGTVWFTMYASQAQTVAITTDGSDFDTVLAVYRAPYYPERPFDVEFVSCNASPGGRAGTTLTTEPNTQYWFQVGGIGGATGQLHLDVRCQPACPPYNDSFGGSEYHEPPSSSEINTAGATLEDGEPRPCGNIGKTVWYSVVVRGNATISVDTSASDFDTVVAVYDGANISPPGGPSHNIACASSSGGTRARLSFAAEANRTYWVQAGGRSGAGGYLVIDFQCDGPCPPPNDSRGYLYELLGSPYSFPYETEVDTSAATTEAGEPLDCGDMGRTVWYTVYAWSPVDIVFITDDSSYETAIAVYEAPSDDAPFSQHTRIACAEGAPGQRASVQFRAGGGREHSFYVQVGGRNGAGGSLRLRADCIGGCPPENDNVAQAWYASPGAYYDIRTVNATLETDEPRPCGNIGSTIWFSFSPAGAGEISLRLSAVDSDFPAVLAVYEVAGASPPGGLKDVACSATGSLDFSVRDGVGYMIQAGGVDGASGNLRLSVRCLEACPAPGGGQGGGIGPLPGSVVGPDTGSGGYLPGSRRH